MNRIVVEYDSKKVLQAFVTSSSSSEHVSLFEAGHLCQVGSQRLSVALSEGTSPKGSKCECACFGHSSRQASALC